ncbi:DUF120 domain-containing protein [Chloroflexota bacterium]
MTTKQHNGSNRKIIRLRGLASSGIGESRFFTEITWVKSQFIDKLGINPFPGTFNITVIAEDKEKFNTVRKSKGIEIIPEDTNFCSAHSFPVLINGKIKGAAIIPHISNYPQAQLEVISAENIKQSLSLEDGDPVDIEVILR